MKNKLIVFDVDGTIAGFGKPVEEEVAGALRGLENTGARIALASGKNISYLEGLARGVGIKNPVLIGENGCVIFDPNDSKEYLLAEKSPEMEDVAGKIVEKFASRGVIQLNKVQFTIFPIDDGSMTEIKEFIGEITKPLAKEVAVLKHVDAVDIIPAGVDKGVALSKIKEVYNYNKEDIIAVGDAENDIPMFRESGLPIVIGDKIFKFEAVKKFAHIREAIAFIVKR